MNDDDAHSVELSAYDRFHTFYLVMTVGLPSLVCVGIFVVSGGDAFWLLPIVFFGVVGALNFYLFKFARPIPKRVCLDDQGIAFTTKSGTELSFGWSEVDAVREHLRGLRFRHHVELRFKTSSETLRLYRTSLKISVKDGRPVDTEVSDTMIGTIITWDRPIRLARSIIARHVPGFEA